MSEKFEESNEKKREKRPRDDNIDREKDSYVSYYIFSIKIIRINMNLNYLCCVVFI